ncbi:unnamed protein product [Cuscuta epithymum]|uniref:Pectin acetylesterase n=1 Tax=Cuscuta epithymum TaxID=186058 RepID=A0AAV0CR72_9ASTE|nr:unnamed protein product [Cuscuta epithymum]
MSFFGILQSLLFVSFFLIKCDGTDDEFLVNATLVRSDPEAVCLTGKPAAYYFDHGFGDGVRNWLVYLEGGAWCNLPEYCATAYAHTRNLTLDPKPYSFKDILSKKKEENPGHQDLFQRRTHIQSSNA